LSKARFYSARTHRQHFSLMRFEAVIPEPAEDYKNRNVVEPAFNQLKN
jgi:hypothetical protein